MSNRRVPLASNPNAANSPYRTTAAGSTKRPRSFAQDQRESEYSQAPPAKKQLLDQQCNGSRRQHSIPVDNAEGRVFVGKSLNHVHNDFNKKLAAVQTSVCEDRKYTERHERISHVDVETVRQWRKHYRKVFPGFVFYFESVSQDVCIRCSRQISALGAREEKFFSRAVTHIVTTRPIPSDTSNTSPTDITKDGHGAQPHTINPSLLDKSLEAHLAVIQRKAKQSSPQKKIQNHNDVLHKAREMGMKIWALEKFDRMMNTMFTPDIKDEGHHTCQSARAATHPSRRGGDADLQQLLRNEKLNATVEKAAVAEIVPLKGYYIYVHDMDEKTRPVMVREYHKNDPHEWPQFQSVSNGRCPWIPEAQPRDDHTEKEHQAEKQVKENAPRTRAAAAAIEAAREQSPAQDAKRGPLCETSNNANAVRKSNMPAPPSAKTFEPQLNRTAGGSLDSMPPMLGSTRANYRGLIGKPGGEPVASGVQQANITSAIRSQMISSTSAAPGARAGTSKEVHKLQRKILERNSGLSVGSIPSSYMNDVRAAINTEHQPPARRTTRQNPPEALARIEEDELLTDEGQTKMAPLKASRAPKKKRPVRREPKPGYCENCRDKYDDFHEHVQSRKHRKFAITADNWSELDKLLTHLVRR